MFVRIENNEIQEIVHSEVHIKNRMLPKDRMFKVDTSNKPRVSEWEYLTRGEVELIDGTPVLHYNVKTYSPKLYKEILKEKIAAYRYAKEISGVTLDDGTKIATDRDAQDAINRTLSSFKNSIIDEAQWKTEDGFITVDLDKMEEIATDVFQYVQALFASEKTAGEAVDAIETIDDLKDYNWRQHF